MRKLALNVMIAFLAVGMLSFTGIEKEVKTVKTDKSKITWKGYKMTGSHYGSVDIKSGNLVFDNDALVGGEFVADLTSITSEDLEGEYKGKLEGHLKSDDFFGVEKFPTATLVFTKVKPVGKNSYEVTGDLTVKGITKSVTFDMAIYGSKANATVKIDRSAYNVKYGSASFFDDLKDKVIYDEFDLVVDLEF
ncbi:YceI family protein [Namhaeicola litoreus]|uniref:YceI family protein n=1 Tax=Namhaeicola litoreus TaxID=1052145 RepID=A0ABW3Y3K7_9FLAO